MIAEGTSPHAPVYVPQSSPGVGYAVVTLSLSSSGTCTALSSPLYLASKIRPLLITFLIASMPFFEINPERTAAASDVEAAFTL